VRTVPIPTWVKSAMDAWTAAADITHGRVFRAINKAGRVWGDGISPRRSGTSSARRRLAPASTSWPRTIFGASVPVCANLAGGELDQIQFLLGHVSIQRTERYLGCKQKLRVAVNDRFGIEPDAA
jgi:hypothetical protein